MVVKEYNFDNIYKEYELNNNVQKVGIILDDFNKLKKSKLFSSFSLINNDNFEFYYIDKSKFEEFKNNCLVDFFLLDILVIYNDAFDFNFLNYIVSKCKLFGVPFLQIFDNYFENKNDYNVEYILRNSDSVILVETNNEHKFDNVDIPLYIINKINEINFQEFLLKILIENKRNKSSLLYEFFELFIHKKNVGKNLLFIDFINDYNHEIILKSRLFDVNWYLNEYPDVKEANIPPIKHYVNFGVFEGCNPSPDFNTKQYLDENLFINMNPFVHFILYNDFNKFSSLNISEKEDFDKYLRFNNRTIIHNELDYLKKNSKGLFFSDFEGFLAKSYISPLISAPFSFNDKRVFAFMDHLAKILRKNLQEANFNPLISVILPVFNRVEVVQNAIDSVLSQSYQNFELIIIDDGSYDGTEKLLNELTHEKIRIFTNKSNQGVSYSRNIGLRNSKGEYIAYLDSDNQWDSKYLESMIGAFFRLNDADALYSGQLLYENEEPIAMRFASFNKSLMHNNSFIDLNCFCHHRNVLKKVFGFNEKYQCLEDWDFILRIMKFFKIYSVPILLSKYYINNTNNRLSDNLSIRVTDDFLSDKNFEVENCNLKLKKMISVIIPSFEILDDLKECLETIFSFKLGKFIEIIVVDNNSQPNVKSYLKSLEKNGKIKLILNDFNYGFTYAVNQGIAISNSDSDILILNNDAVLTENSLEYMQHYAYSLKDCGIIVPQQILISGGSHQIKAHVPYANHLINCDANPSKAHNNIINAPLFHDGEVLELSFAPFFCTYIKRDVLNKSLMLDAELGRHYRSDRIFSNFVKFVLNQKIYHISKSRVFHKSQVSTENLKKNKKDYDYIFLKNQWEPELAQKLNYKTALWDF